MYPSCPRFIFLAVSCFRPTSPIRDQGEGRRRSSGRLPPGASPTPSPSPSPSRSPNNERIKRSSRQSREGQPSSSHGAHTTSAVKISQRGFQFFCPIMGTHLRILYVFGAWQVSCQPLYPYTRFHIQKTMCSCWTRSSERQLGANESSQAVHHPGKYFQICRTTEC